MEIELTPYTSSNRFAQVLLSFRLRIKGWLEKKMFVVSYFKAYIVHLYSNT